MSDLDQEKSRAEQLAINCRWLIARLDEVHAALCINQTGSWQDRAIQAVDSARGCRDEIKSLRNVCAEAYQLAGVYDAPVKALDNLSAAANGEPLPHDSFLPIVLAAN